jgi:hypothetical protein
MERRAPGFCTLGVFFLSWVRYIDWIFGNSYNLTDTRGWSSPGKRLGRADNSYYAGIREVTTDFVRPRHGPEGVCRMVFHSILFENTKDSKKKRNF